MKKVIALILLLTVCSCLSKIEGNNSVSRKNTRTLGWDLSYQNFLKENQIKDDEWISEWINDLQKFTYGDVGEEKFVSPILQEILEWTGEPIVSSILIEYPGFHAGEHLTAWYVRTKNKLYILEYNQVKFAPKKEMDPGCYDDAFAEIFSWKQSKKLTREDHPKIEIPGYAAILSVYNKNESRQIFLNFEDLIVLLHKTILVCNAGK